MESFERSEDRGRWQALLARWGLFTALAVAGLVTTFFTAYGLASSRPGIGGDHDELLMAAAVPVLYRIAMVFDALGWLAMGGLIVIAGLGLRREATVRGPLAAALGVTAVVGIFGAFLRLIAIGELGKQLAGGAAQADLLPLFRSVEWVISAAFAAGQLTNGLGFLVVGSAALAVAWVPRRIGWLLVLPGVTSLVLLGAEVVLDVFLFPVLLVHVGLLAAAGLALAATWWRATSADANAVRPVPAAM
jgi:hypothetical protein